MSTTQPPAPAPDEELAPASTATPTGLGEPPESIGSAVSAYVDKVKAGDLGSLPIILGLIVIAIFFQSQNSNFLSAPNFINLLLQMSITMTIALGVVFVLLLGEIDLSIGYVSGVGAVAATLFLLPDGNIFWRVGAWLTPGGDSISGFTVIVLVGLIGAAIGFLHGVLIAKLGLPSFVVTLAGLLAWSGIVLLMIGSRGTVTLQNYVLIDVANKFLSHRDAFIMATVVTLLFALVTFARLIGRKRAGLLPHGIPTAAIMLAIARVAVVGGLIFIAVIVCNRDPHRGFPVVGLILIVLLAFWSFVATRTRFGRHVYAVGGSAEASRRAGISVDRIKIAVFMISSLMAALGGIMYASRLYGVDTGAGGGTQLLDSIAAAVIGGTSLFGGRGHPKSALYGALVITSVSNGLGLMNVRDGVKFLISGLILLAAITVDSLSRRRLAATGR
jgi:D-xylose transport system permease protein